MSAKKQEQLRLLHLQKWGLTWIEKLSCCTCMLHERIHCFESEQGLNDSLDRELVGIRKAEVELSIY